MAVGSPASGAHERGGSEDEGNADHRGGTSDDRVLNPSEPIRTLLIVRPPPSPVKPPRPSARAARVERVPPVELGLAAPVVTPPPPTPVPPWTPPDDCRGLVFDCDGTLVDSMPLHYRSYVAVLEPHGLSFDEDQFYDWAGVPVVDVIRRLADAQGREVDAPALAAERDAHFHALPESDLRRVDAVTDLADRYRGRLPMIVATGSTRPSAEASLRAIGVLDWFEGVVSSWDVGRPKPAPDVFLAAADRIGVDPTDCARVRGRRGGLGGGPCSGHARRRHPPVAPAVWQRWVVVGVVIGHATHGPHRPATTRGRHGPPNGRGRARLPPRSPSRRRPPRTRCRRRAVSAGPGQ